ncbi:MULTISPECIES: DUF551 domain-containing protein [Escherichia]|uniref:DUF551 domain-containing protein n=1 Tax=Escherichia TaxID=561 RepID=UPI0015EA632C|nr:MULTISPECIES: DUF551 domain-containing protein [Escherichia]MDK2399044.1 DUF551 domain-containing protein [Escherichia coli]QML68706.1 DUF551 domain-containing protein [Escherichia fergusonii]
MNKIDYQALREAAEKAGEDKWQAKKINGDFFVIRHGSYTRQHGYTSYQPIAEIDCKPVRDFVAKANPATVLELLDELEAAKKRIAELEAEPVSQTYKLNQLSGNSPVTPDGWISCSERMPEMGERQCYVLAADFKNNYPPNIPNTQVGVYGDWFNDGNPTWDDGDGEDLYLKEVTHWMPLPEPPRLKEL